MKRQYSKSSLVIANRYIIPFKRGKFKRVDEDLFYRNRRGDREDFIPSEGEININFDGVKIIIKQRD